jgi:hypothetical protein
MKTSFSSSLKIYLYFDLDFIRSIRETLVEVPFNKSYDYLILLSISDYINPAYPRIFKAVAKVILEKDKRDSSLY